MSSMPPAACMPEMFARPAIATCPAMLASLYKGVHPRINLGPTLHICTQKMGMHAPGAHLVVNVQLAHLRLHALPRLLLHLLALYLLQVCLPHLACGAQAGSRGSNQAQTTHAQGMQPW